MPGGRRRIQVRVGSTNPVKIEAVRRVFRRLLHRPLEVRGREVDSGVPFQPHGRETLRGALNRAQQVMGEADFGVGIEAGLFRIPEAGVWFDVQYCAIVDRTGLVTWGHGPGFLYPPAVLSAVDRGKTVGEAARAITGKRAIGRGIGMIGYLTKGAENRRELTEQAVLMAMVPRLRRDLYRDGGGTG